MTCYTDPELFFDPAREGEAVEACAGCPLAVSCVARSEDEEYGVWGGSTPIERAARRFSRATPNTSGRDQAFALVVELCAERGITTVAGVAAASRIRWDVVAKRMNVDATELDRQIAALRAEGMTLAAIALRLGCTKDFVFRAVRRPSGGGVAA
ncbi:WhiB family transcriptional regulator [Micromonospora sp. NPDC049101]|uniref:WhiB family transcriptional regulator n=1 Tax=Micromonospora sp. NPDC049101 TaxID=3155032 RepID=UPI00340E66A9